MDELTAEQKEQLTKLAVPLRPGRDTRFPKMWAINRFAISNRELLVIGEAYGVRRRGKWPFKENWASYRLRVHDVMRYGHIGQLFREHMGTLPKEGK